jgi:4-amino-4-deoxy-L-arabinose transferase-like glycosyltransferase
MVSMLQLLPLATWDTESGIDVVGAHPDGAEHICPSTADTMARAVSEDLAGCATAASQLTRAQSQQSAGLSSPRHRPKYAGDPYHTVSLAEVRSRYRDQAAFEVAPTPLWSWAALVAILTVLGVFWILGLQRAGSADSAYLDAVHAGAGNWKAFLFGSSGAVSDGGTAAPASLWLAEIAVRTLGTHSWSPAIVPVLLSLASVALLFVVVKRPFGAVAGLIACVVFGVTPAVTAALQHHSPDALLVFLMVGAAWCLTRAVGDGRTQWLVGCGVLIGVGLLAAHLRVVVIAPGVALTYLIAGPVGFSRRAAQVLAGVAAALAIAGGWLMARTVTGSDQSVYSSVLTEAKRIAGFVDLETRRVVVGQTVGAIESRFTTAGGVDHGFGSSVVQISWLLPAAAVALVTGILLCGRMSRTDKPRAGYLLFGSWLLGCAAVLCVLSRGFHAYDTALLAPAIAAVVGMGVVHLWSRRHSRRGGLTLAAVVASSVLWSWVLLERTPEMASLRWTVLIGGGLAMVLLVVARTRLDYLTGNRITSWAATVAAVVALAGPAAYTVDLYLPRHARAVVADQLSSIVQPPQAASTSGVPSAVAMPSPPGRPLEDRR